MENLLNERPGIGSFRLCRRGLGIPFFLAYVVATLASIATAEQPNIIVVMCDDLGFGDLASYGHPHIKSPHLGRMAEDGTRFTDFYSAAPVCSPLRVGLLSGRSPNRAGAYHHIPPAHKPQPDQRHLVYLRQSEVTIPQFLKSAGYATAMAGKWHRNSEFNSEVQPQPDDAGIDHLLATQNNTDPSHANSNNFVRNGELLGEIEGFSCRIVVDEGINWMEDHLAEAAEQSFFLYLAFHEPHEPVASPVEMTVGYSAITIYEKEAEYFANVENLDLAVGRLLDYLKHADIDDDTPVTFTSDNGPETLSRYARSSHSWGRADPLCGMKLWTTEAAGIMRWPGRITPGQVSDEVISSLDVLPTFYDLAGIDPPAGLTIDGVNFLPALERQTLQREKPLLWAFYNPRNEYQVAMCDGAWKVLARIDVSKAHNLHTGNIEGIKSAPLRDIQVFNLEHDIGEMRNLARDFPAIRDRLQLRLEKHYQRAFG
jgi:arylsulfatase A